METVDSLVTKVNALTAAGHRGRLLARGLARGMIWRDGVLPPDSPNFTPMLTTDLLDHGFRLLDSALALREISQGHAHPNHAFRVAGEAIESAVRRGDASDPQYGFHLACAAASFHIGHYSARAFCLLRGDLDRLNLSSPERLLVLLMKRQLSHLTDECVRWLESSEHTDEGLATLLEQNDAGLEDAVFISLAKNFCHAIAGFEFALETGQASLVEATISRLTRGLSAAAECGHIPAWWIYRLARHLLGDLWDQSYHNRLPMLPPDTDGRWNELRRDFIQFLATRDLAHVDFWPSQLAAATRAVNVTDDLVVALPTSSGKTRVAELCILRCLADGRRVVYVTPLRALSAQIEATLAAVFSPLGFSATSVYGASGVAAADVETLRSADIVVATPEKLDFAIRQDPDVISDVGLIVLDEGHMIGLGEREIRYESLVQRLLHRDDAELRRIVCLSAIFSQGPSFDAFNDWIRSGESGEPIRSTWRPTRQRPGTLTWTGNAARLDYTVEGEAVFVPHFVDAKPGQGRRQRDFPGDRNELIVASVDQFVRRGQCVLVYCPIRKSVETLAECFLKGARQGYVTTWLHPTHQESIEAAVQIGREWLGDDHPAVAALRLGIAVHHGQLPRAFLRELEKLLRKRILPVAISSPTLAQGVDLSFEVLILNSLWRNQKLIPASEFANVIGRVGRAHVDLDGIYLLPIFDQGSARVTREREFHHLIDAAKQRNMESGLLLLLRLFAGVLAEKLNVGANELAEYVVNNNHFWDNVADGEGDADKWLRVATNELDNGLLSMIPDLDCDPSVVADRLDEALADSYWARRLAVQDVSQQKAQRGILRSRINWLWQKTDAPRRRGCFAAGIGYTAGEVIASQANLLAQLLTEAEKAIVSGQHDAASLAVIGIAEVLLPVYPFCCDQPEGWQDIIRGWLSGRPTSQFTDSEGIGFVQDGIVYRLVWAVESVRTELGALGVLPTEAVEGKLALCLTFGTPNIASALIQQAGMSSRTLAVELVAQLGLYFSDTDGLKDWLQDVLKGDVKPALNLENQLEWGRFVRQLQTRFGGKWYRGTGTHPVVWDQPPPPPGSPLRTRDAGDQRHIQLLTPELQYLGKIEGRRLIEGGRTLAEVDDDGISVRITRFGPSPPR